MRNTLLAVIAALILLSPSLGAAQDVVVPYENLVSVLSGYHGAPGPDYWERLEPESTKQNLMRIVEDPEVFTVVRARAMTALTYFDGEEVESLLTQKARTEKTGYMRAAAYEALAEAKGKGATRALGEALQDEDTIVRLTAVRSLRKIGGPEAKKVLREGMEREKNPTARSVMSKALEQMR